MDTYSMQKLKGMGNMAYATSIWSIKIWSCRMLFPLRMVLTCLWSENVKSTMQISAEGLVAAQKTSSIQNVNAIAVLNDK